ncbi:MAG: hypothetical protein Q9160_001071 [Pyrenula sp. 1 TL-2023]
MATNDPSLETAVASLAPETPQPPKRIKSLKRPRAPPKEYPRVALVAPSDRFLTPDELSQGENALQWHRFGMKEFINHELDGTPLPYNIPGRVQEIHNAFEDQSVSIVLCLAGGVSANELLPYLDYDLIRASPQDFSEHGDKDDTPSMSHLAGERCALTDLAKAGIFNQISGLIVGRPKANTEKMRQAWDEVVLGFCEMAGRAFPVLANVNVGHTEPKLTVPLGALCRIDAEKDEWRILEPIFAGSNDDGSDDDDPVGGGLRGEQSGGKGSGAGGAGASKEEEPEGEARTKETRPKETRPKETRPKGKKPKGKGPKAEEALRKVQESGENEQSNDEPIERKKEWDSWNSTWVPD